MARRLCGNAHRGRTTVPRCDGQVLGVDQSEIHWSAFISNRPSAEIAALYERRLGSGLLEKTEGQWTWRDPARDDPTHVLSVTGPEGVVPGQCARLPDGVGTLAVLSPMLRR